MHNDLRTLLNAYLDGELNGTRLNDIKHHLTTCKSCQNELKELSDVSHLLKAEPYPEFMPTERFASNLILGLPRRTSHNLYPRIRSLSWWLIPAGLLGAWFFVQTVFTLTNVFVVAQTSGILGQSANVLAGGQQTFWFTAISNLFGGQVDGLQSTLSLLNRLNLFSSTLLDGFLWQALIVLLYLGWLCAFWLRPHQQPVEMGKA